MHKFVKFSSNRRKLHIEVFVHLLKYIRDNNTFGLKYDADMNDAPLSDLLRQANIKNENKLMAFSDSSWKYCPYIVRSIGEYIIFYQGGPIDHGKHGPGPVSQPRA